MAGWAPAIEPVRADDRTAMDGWFGLLQVSHAHDAPELPPPCPLSHASRFDRPGFERRAWVDRPPTGRSGPGRRVPPVCRSAAWPGRDAPPARPPGRPAAEKRPRRRRPRVGARLPARAVDGTHTAGAPRRHRGAHRPHVDRRPDGRPGPGSAALGRRTGARARRRGGAQRRALRRRRRPGPRRPARRLHRGEHLRGGGRLREPGRHARRAGAPGPPPGAVDQAREPGAAAARAPGGAGDRHVQRRRQPVAINEQLGFRPLRRQTDWELGL
jgi:hypothetical protein